MAVVDLDAKAITLNTVDGEFASQPWWWEQQGLPYSSKTRNNEDWYKRLGYTPYKRAVPRYPCKTVDGRDILLESVVRHLVSLLCIAPVLEPDVLRLLSVHAQGTAMELMAMGRWQPLLEDEHLETDETDGQIDVLRWYEVAKFHESIHTHTGKMGGGRIRKHKKR